jgi:uroporphyrinogen-III decarboxylase
MNPLERMSKRLAGGPVDRVPNFDILMGFAARYCVENGGPKYISAAGCEIPEGAPQENMPAQRQVLSGWPHD